MRIEIDAREGREISTGGLPRPGGTLEVSGALWEIDGSGLTDLRLHPDDRRVLTAKVEPNQRGAAMIRLRPARVGDLALRWPVGLAEPFRASVQYVCPPESQPSQPRVSLYYKDALCRFHEASLGAEQTLPVEGADDLTEVGICLRWPNAQTPLVGSLTIHIDRMVLQASARHDQPLPVEGERVATLDAKRTWRADEAYLGIVATRHEADRIHLMCDLDSTNVRLRRGMIWVRAGKGGQPIDLSGKGAFVTVRGPVGMKCRVSVGMRDAEGNVFWGRGRPIVAADEPTTAGFYPEIRYPVPSSFCSERFDPQRATDVGLSISVGSDDPRRVAVKGDVVVDDLRIVAMPDAVRAEHDRIAERIGRLHWLSTVVAGDPGRTFASVPIGVFLDNVGVNYPWPRGVYPSVGQRLWDPTQGGFSGCVDQLRNDFEYLNRRHVRLVRVFIFCDTRTGFVEDQDGPKALDAFVMQDLRALLDTVERFETLRLLPVLFDFHMADGRERNELGLVGEHPDWIIDEAKRRRLFGVIEPVVGVLCAHPQVACIDLMNEPEHAAAVNAGEMYEFLTELAGRIRGRSQGRESGEGPVTAGGTGEGKGGAATSRSYRKVPLTVGSASALYAPFWQSTGIDLTTCHWFERIHLSHPLGQRASGLNANDAVMTEVDPSIGVGKALETVWQSGFRGAVFWSLNGEDAYSFRGPPAEVFRQWVEAHVPRMQLSHP